MTNPAREALSRVVNRAIASGAPIVTEQAAPTTIDALHKLSNEASAAFEAECAKHYVNGKWGFYRAVDDGKATKGRCAELSDAAIAAVHTYYVARDGEHGFLGSRGV